MLRRRLKGGGSGALYVPSFKSAVHFFCIHAGGRAVLDGIEKNLRLSREDLEPSRAVLHEQGNTSSSSIWCAWATPPSPPEPASEPASAPATAAGHSSQPRQPATAASHSNQPHQLCRPATHIAAFSIHTAQRALCRPTSPRPSLSTPIARFGRYELRFVEQHKGLRRGHKILQLSFGSGFKCNSAVWTRMH